MKKVSIDSHAKAQLSKAYKYIKTDSLQNAEKVKKKILTSFKELLTKPALHAPDKYKLNNDGSFRAYEIYKYRISYFLSDNEIRILSVRHSKMEPIKY